MNNPEYVKIGNKKYKINTSYKIAIECNEIAQDTNIDDNERALAIIFKLFGDDGIDCPNDWDMLLKLGLKYLSCGNNIDNKNDDVNMDYIQDMNYIEASFMSDYGIDLSKDDMNWYKFNNLINGLSNSDMGNCCVLNRIRNLRDLDLSTIKDSKERQKLAKVQKQIALNKKQRKITQQELDSANEFYRLTGIRKE